MLQALLRGALTQQSAVILVCMAIDRYICMLHPKRYFQKSRKVSFIIFYFCWKLLYVCVVYCLDGKSCDLIKECSFPLFDVSK